MTCRKPVQNHRPAPPSGVPRKPASTSDAATKESDPKQRQRSTWSRRRHRQHVGLVHQLHAEVARAKICAPALLSGAAAAAERRRGPPRRTPSAPGGSSAREIAARRPVPTSGAADMACIGLGRAKVSNPNQRESHGVWSRLAALTCRSRIACQSWTGGCSAL